MAQEWLVLGADFSEVENALKNFQGTLEESEKRVERFIVKTAQFNEEGTIQRATVEGLSKVGERYLFTLGRMEDQFSVISTKVSQTSQSLKEFRKQQEEGLAKANFATAKTQAESFIQQNYNPQEQQVQTAPLLLQNRLRTAQQAFTKTLSETGLPSAEVQALFDRIQKGFVDIEQGARGRVQAALFGLNKAFKDLGDSADKAQAKIDAAFKKTEQRAEATKAETLIRSRFPVPAGADIVQINKYESALQRILKLLTDGKISAADFKSVFDKLSISGFNQILPNLTPQQAQVRSLLGAVSTSFNETGAAGERAAQRITISWQGMIRILEVQAFHRVLASVFSTFGEGIKNATEFANKIAEIRTISQQGGLTAADWESQIKRLSNTFATSFRDTTSAIYEAISNQVVTARESGEFLQQALLFGRTTQTSAIDSVNLLSSALNSYHLSASDAERVSASLFKTIEVGRVRGTELANTYGRLLPLASALGVSYDEVGAAIATITVQGTRSSEALTYLNGLLSHLLKPTKDMKDLFREWGVESGQAAIATFGFTGVLQKLNEEVQSKGAGRLGELERDLRAIRGALGLTGNNLQVFQNNLRTVQEASIDYANAQNIILTNPLFKFEQELTKIQNIFSGSFGNDFIQRILALTEPLGGLSGIVEKFIDGLLQAIKLGTDFASVFSNILSSVAPILPSLETTVTLFASYGTAVLAARAANLLFATDTTIISSLANVGSALSQTIARHFGVIAAKQADAAATSADTVALTANTVATKTNDLANLSLLQRVRISVAERALAAGKIDAETFAKIRNTEITNANAAAQTRAALASTALGLSLTAVIAAFITSSQNTQEALQSIERLAGESSVKINEDKAKQEERIRDREIEGFRKEFDDRARIVAQFIANTRKEFNELIDNTHRASVNIAGELGEVFRQLAGEAKDQAQTFKQLATEIERGIKQSQSQVTQIKIKSETREFERSLIGKSQQEQTQLTLNKVNTLAQEGANLFNSDNLEEARKKFEEIDKLLESIFSRQRSFRERAQKLGVVFEGSLAGGAVDSRILQFQNQRIRLEEQYQQRQINRLRGARDAEEANLELNRQALTVEQARTRNLEAFNRARSGRLEAERSQRSAREVLNTNIGTIADAVGQVGTVGGVEFGLNPNLFSRKRSAELGVDRLREALAAFNQDQSNENIENLTLTLGRARTAVVNLFANISGKEGDAERFGQIFTRLQDNLLVFLRSRNQITDYNAQLNNLRAANTDLNAQLDRLTPQLGNAAQNAQNAVQVQVAFGDQIRRNNEDIINGLERILELRNRLNDLGPNLNAPAPVNRALGGPIGNDRNLVLASRGEFFVNAPASRKFTPQLAAINMGAIPQFASGGSVTNVGDVNVNVTGKESAQATVREIGRELRREIRRGNISFT